MAVSRFKDFVVENYSPEAKNLSKMIDAVWGKYRDLWVGLKDDLDCPEKVIADLDDTRKKWLKAAEEIDSDGPDGAMFLKAFNNAVMTTATITRRHRGYKKDRGFRKIELVGKEDVGKHLAAIQKEVDRAVALHDKIKAARG